MTECKLCCSEFTLMQRKHTCRLCRSAICESCSVFKTKEEMEEYSWCTQWLSKQMPSLISLMMHDTKVRLCRHCANWNQSNTKTWWMMYQLNMLSIRDMQALSCTNGMNHFLTSLLLHRIKRKQRRSILYNTPLTNVEKSECLIHIKNEYERHRWNYIQSGAIPLPRSRSIIHTIELLWKMRRIEQCLNDAEKRTLFGFIWSNREKDELKLLYTLAKDMKVDFIPLSLQKKYEMSEDIINSWTNWIQSGGVSPEIDTAPSAPCPVWNIDIQTKKSEVSFKVFPSATQPIMMRWGKDNRGLLWKREAGSVDRFIEYSVAICSLGLRQENILTEPQIWYDVVQLKRDIVAIQIVPDCISLSSLQEQKKSILEFVCDHNDGRSVASIRKKLMESIAFSCAVSWFFGFGDRHLDNIMITKDGSIFHIDFGFCFGREPKIGVSRIRVTKDMVQSLGKEYWNTCLEKGQQIMDWLRNHQTSLRVMTDFASGDSKNHIEMHWRTIMNDPVTFEELVNESMNSWTTGIHDFFHSSAQSLRSMSSIWSSITG